MPLTPANAERFSRLHPRCGTTFLLLVMVVAIFVFAPIGLPAWYWLLAHAHRRRPADRRHLLRADQARAADTAAAAGCRAIMWPGIQLQHLTTREPDRAQLAVAIAALEAVLAAEPDLLTTDARGPHRRRGRRLTGRISRASVASGSVMRPETHTDRRDRGVGGAAVGRGRAGAQLLDAGLSPTMIGERVRGGRLLRSIEGVYAVGHTRLRREGHWLAAVLAVGSGRRAEPPRCGGRCMTCGRPTTSGST